MCNCITKPNTSWLLYIRVTKTLRYQLCRKVSLCCCGLKQHCAPGPLWDLSITYTDGMALPALPGWLMEWEEMEWGCQEWFLGTSLHFLFPWIGISLLLRAWQYHYYCIHMFYWEAPLGTQSPCSATFISLIGHLLSSPSPVRRLHLIVFHL